jgi:hypothetical protein
MEEQAIVSNVLWAAQKHGYPRHAHVWQGVLLGLIAHALRLPSGRHPSYERWWEGRTYLRNDESGTRGAITFAGGRLVAGFCDLHSPRSPWQPGVPYNPSPLLTTIPMDLLRIAQREAFQYVCYDYEGKVQPIITAAFWSDGDRLVGAEPWEMIDWHGAHGVRIETLPPALALAEWQNEYQLTTAQMDLVDSLCQRKQRGGAEPIVLNEDEMAVVVSEGSIGLEFARQLFGAIGIIVP